MATPTPSMIARRLLYALNDKIRDDSEPELLLQLGTLAAQVAIAERLAGIEVPRRRHRRPHTRQLAVDLSNVSGGVCGAHVRRRGVAGA
ncbi:hypothetical protein QRX50_35035 [Amycolatopsis carbonis]|uniref:Uncharacterized protein n=1 Tax=Amycolatopsis carbonis TaxID=715471 RepID=A0A9Y2IAS7_9PSEU|nr:hypothetical protein [Amycolatopsis sp. 2-15]WIX76642.1 hypothetical protein QRX50_35035 [Amycolatopsis sp. 2-15]